MRNETITLYKFSELSQTAKEKVLNKHYDINVDCQWWKSVYDDALNVGIKITGFDIDRGSCCEIKKFDCLEVARLIKCEHGESCETYKLSEKYLDSYDNIVHKYSDGINTDRVHEDKIEDFDIAADELENEFRNDIANAYLTILRNEYDYLTTEKAIIERIEANEYEFTEDGTIY